MRVSAPQFINLCYYGTDIESKENLISCKHTPEEICKLANMDSLGFLDVEDLSKLIGEENNNSICAACFNNKYPTKIPENNKEEKI